MCSVEITNDIVERGTMVCVIRYGSAQTQSGKPLLSFDSQQCFIYSRYRIRIHGLRLVSYDLEAKLRW